MSFEKQVAENYRNVMERVARACKRAGRSPADVTLIAVTKSADVPWIQALVDLGAHDLGESRPQQLIERAERITGPVRWHLIGHLQRNKVRQVLPVVSMIHSIDSPRLLTRVDELAGELQLSPKVLLEVNISGENSKGGFTSKEIVEAWETILSCRHVRISGLMTMAPLVDNPQEIRPVFRGLRELRDRLRDASPPEITLPELSMGMSNDYEAAVEEGATMIRVGSSLFEGIALSETD